MRTENYPARVLLLAEKAGAVCWRKWGGLPVSFARQRLGGFAKNDQWHDSLPVLRAGHGMLGTRRGRALPERGHAPRPSRKRAYGNGIPPSFSPELSRSAIRRSRGQPAFRSATSSWSGKASSRTRAIFGPAQGSPASRYPGLWPEYRLATHRANRPAGQPVVVLSRILRMKVQI